MLDKPIAIIDIETTGGSSAYNAITEIGIIKIHQGKIIDQYHTLVNPGRSIPAQITQLTGINSTMVRDAPYFADIAQKIDGMFKDSYFMAHHVVFDFSFIKRQMKASGYDFTPRLLCSVKLSRAIEVGIKGHSLQKIIERNNIPVSARHRALDDAIAVKDYLDILIKKYGEAIVTEKLYAQLKLKSTPSNLDTSFLDGVDNTPGVYIFKDAEATPVYIGKSITLRNRILSHFSQSTTLNKEMKISMSTHTLEVFKTDSELEALLLESKLIKQNLPMYNQRLRRKNQYVILLKELNADGYVTIKLYRGKVEDLKDTGSVYGVYDNRIQAKKALERHRDTYGLCSKLLGLEASKDACFRYQLGKCRGACIGKISPSLSNISMDIAFERSRIESWKYSGPIYISTSPNKALVIDQWKVVKVIQEGDTNIMLTNTETVEFDIDSYKIISAFIKKNPQTVTLCSGLQAL